MDQHLNSNPEAAIGSAPRKRAKRSTRRAAAPAHAEIRPVRRRDLDDVIAIDASVTGIEKRAYWESIHRRYGRDDLRLMPSDNKTLGFQCHRSERKMKS